MKGVTGKKILLIVPAFYSYEKFIKQELERNGAIVFYVENKAFRNDPLSKGSKSFLTFLCAKNRYIIDNLIPLSLEKFDICFFINLFSFHPRVIDNLRNRNPKITCILYLWDNIKGYRWQQFFKYFDKIYSFDPVEASIFKIKYLPNFYPATNILESKEVSRFDLSFVGSLQVHRFKILEALIPALHAQHKNFLFYLHLHPNYDKLKFNKFIYALLNIFPSQFKGYRFIYDLICGRTQYEFVHRTPISIEEAAQIMRHSQCVLDLPSPWQTGSTQRVIQALSLQKKVITTNVSVVDEEFYSPEFIKIVSSDNLFIDWNWINTKPNTEIDVTHLRLDRWLTQIMP